MSDTMGLVMIAATEAKSKVDTAQPLPDQFRAAMNITKDFFLTTDQDVRFRGAVAAVLLANEDSEEVRTRITQEMRSLNTLSAAMSGVPVNWDEAFDEEHEPIGILKIWKEVEQT